MSYRYRTDLKDAEFALMVQNPEIFTSMKKAHRWASGSLASIHPDESWCIYVIREDDGQFCCSISQPSWPGDHCGDKRSTGALAIIQAVLELINE